MKKLTLVTSIFALALLVSCGAKDSASESSDVGTDATTQSVDGDSDAENSPTTKYEIEVGDEPFVVEPKRSPLEVRDGKRVWECEGLVNEKFLDIVHGEMTAIANARQFTAPDRSDCQWQIDELDGPNGQKIYLYGVDFTTEKDRKKCANGMACSNMRNMTPFPAEGAVWRSYLLTDESGAVESGVSACFDNMGKILSAEKVCAAM
jgi:hypothetical protein